MALEFDTSNYVQIDSGLIGNGNASSVVVWLIPHSPSLSTEKCLYSEDDQNGTSFRLRLYDSKLGFDFVRATSWHNAQGNTNLIADNLYLGVATFSTANGMKVYLNVAVDGTDAYTTPCDATLISNNIAHYTNGATWNYDGVILGVRTLTRELSLAEIKSIYYARDNDNIVSSLAGRWLLNEKPDGTAASGANSVIDISPNGHHGTPVNSPVYRAAPVRLVRPVIMGGF